MLLTYFALAIVHVQMGNQGLAIYYVGRARIILREVRNDNDGKLENALADFIDARIKNEFQNRPELAEHDLEKCLKEAREALPKRHIYLTIVLGTLGLVEERQGKNEAAEEHYRETYEIVRENDLLTHPRAAHIVFLLAKLYLKQGKKDESRQVVDVWLQAHERRPSPFQADALTYAARIRELARDDKESGELLEKALKLYGKEAVTPSRIAYWECRHRMAARDAKKGMLEDAKKRAEGNLEWARKNRGFDRNVLAMSLLQVAWIRLANRESGPEVQGLLEEANNQLQFLGRSQDHRSLICIFNIHYVEYYFLENRLIEAAQEARVALELAANRDEVLLVAEKLTRWSKENGGSGEDAFAKQAVEVLRFAHQQGYIDAKQAGEHFSSLARNKEFEKLLADMKSKQKSKDPKP